MRTATTTTEWHGCYDEQWRGAIVDDAFAHPAKFSRGLITRIYKHMLAEGMLRRGETVVDPFGGIGCGGVVAASLGLKWIGCELEPKFIALALQNFTLHLHTWAQFADPIPMIVQGDSRRLRECLRGVLADAVCCSPPFQGAHNGCATDEETRRRANAGLIRKSGTDYDDYGQTPGQLGSMPTGSVDSIVSSPPYANDTTPREAGWNDGTAREHPRYYGNSDGQLGQSTGETFWSAARDIVRECHAILKPGGWSAWVVKDFVRDKQRVPFCDDWCKLLEACGFTVRQRIHAMLVKEQRHPSLLGDDHVKRTERKSFFRRLAEKNGSPRIDFEEAVFAQGNLLGT